MFLADCGGYAVSLISDKDAHALRGIIEVMRRTNQDRWDKKILG